MDKNRRFRRHAVKWLRKHTIAFYAWCAGLYAALIPLSIWAFPSTTLSLSIIVLGTGLLSSLGSLASVLTDLED